MLSRQINTSHYNIPTLFVFRQLRLDLMTFQTIDKNVRTSYEKDFCFIKTFKNNLTEIHIFRPTPYDSFSVPSFSLNGNNTHSPLEDLLPRRPLPRAAAAPGVSNGLSTPGTALFSGASSSTFSSSRLLRQAAFGFKFRSVKPK